MLIVPPARNPVIELLRGPNGHASGARAFARVAKPVTHLRAALDRIEKEGEFASFVKHIPMVKDLRKNGDRFAIELQFKVAILSVKFGATTKLTRDGENTVRLDYVEGEPRGLSLRFTVHDHGANEALLEIEVGYDIDSLGWLAKHFLRHHPEIRDGAHTGTAVAIVEAMRMAIERS